MTHDERCLAQRKQIMDFMEINHRKPSKFLAEEHGMWNWWKNRQKLMNAGALKESGLRQYKELLSLTENNKHITQYV